tara:strand:+ start:5414 stop:6550 length:1137 start_codon:yes stop_codon:yes gene_type:complete
MSNLLNQGGFGCVYYPGITCKGNIRKKKKFVTKLQKLNFNSINEQEISNIIKTISNYKDYFIPIISSCEVNIKNVDNKSLSKCELISSKSNIKYVLMKSIFVNNTPFLEAIINTDDEKNEIFFNIIESYEYLLEAINILIKTNIVHFDLKFNNILFNSSNDTPQIIDFGISIPFSKLDNSNIKKYFYIYAPDYYIWPLEVHVICFLLNTKKDNYTLTKKDANDISKKMVFSNKALNIYSDNFKNQYLTACENELDKYVGISSQENINNLQKFYKTWDNYALSIMYLKMYYYLFPSGFHRNSMIIKFSQLLLLNISPNPLKRLNIKDTKTSFYNIFNLNNINIDTYTNIIKNMDYDITETTKNINEDMQQLNSKIKKII